MITANSNAYKQVVLVSFESTNSSKIYKENMPNAIFSHLYHDLAHKKCNLLIMMD